jgi:hypothetical protein
MKIGKKINVQKEIDIEIKTPYFTKSANGRVFYKILNEEGHNIRVSTYGFSTSIEFSKTLNEYLIFAQDNIEIKESEFNEAFDYAIKTLKKK